MKAYWPSATLATQAFPSTFWDPELLICALLATFLLAAMVALAWRSSTESARRAAKQGFEASFEFSPLGFAILDSTGVVVHANPSFQSLIGRPAEDLIGRQIIDYVFEADKQDWTVERLKERSGRLHQDTEVRYCLLDGSILRAQMVATETRTTSGGTHFLLQMNNVTDRIEASDELRRIENRDALTGLATRVTMHERVTSILQRSGQRVALIFVDLDCFKSVNDGFGYQTGDELLAAFAKRLTNLAGPTNTVTRFGDDEFVVTYEGAEIGFHPEAFAEQIRDGVETVYELSERSLRASAAVGLAIAGKDDDAEDLIRNADIALFEAKRIGGNCTVTFTAAMLTTLMDQLQLERELLAAIGTDQFCLHYQPIIQASSGQYIGFEALVRWQNPNRGLLMPDQFLPTATKLGVMGEIDKWAMRQAIQQLVDWDTAGLAGSSAWMVSVNAAPISLSNSEYADAIEHTTAANSVDPARLLVEITEQAMIEDQLQAAKALAKIRSHGARIAVDDFGSGYSSLSQLTNLSVDVIKSDRSFLSNLGCGDSVAVLRAVGDLAEALRVPVIVEGVELPSEISALRQLGFDFFQGYTIARPLPPDVIAANSVAAVPWEENVSLSPRVSTSREPAEVFTDAETRAVESVDRSRLKEPV